MKDARPALRGGRSLITITVVGLGRIGCVTAGCLAELGHRVWGVDTDESKVASVAAGRLPFYEDRLQPILERAVSGGKLTATADLRQALAESSLAMICVNTGSAPGSGADLSALLEVVDLIREAHRDGVFKGTVVIRSTVPPGTCDQLLARRVRSSGMELVANPEFMREGSSVTDFMHPSLIVIGGDNHRAIQSVAELYASLHRDITVVGFREAEIIKYACNSFHALKIAFANEMGSICGALGIDGEQVMQVLRSDAKLNASAAYLRPGFAFGGYCLPKDVRVLNECAESLGVEVPLLRAILPSNSKHLDRALESVLDLGQSPVGVYGISFKGGTDDLRESPGLLLVRELLRRGMRVEIFDPVVNASLAISGNSLVEREIQDRMTPDLGPWLEQVKCAVLTQPVDIETMARIQASRLPVLNLWQSLPAAPALRGIES
jgi:GDP-mannose 6-dehydrogenase